MKAWKKEKVALSWLPFQMQNAAAAADSGSATPTSFHSTAGQTGSQNRENLIWFLCLCLGKLTQNKVVAKKGDNERGERKLVLEGRKKKETYSGRLPNKWQTLWSPGSWWVYKLTLLRKWLVFPLWAPVSLRGTHRSVVSAAGINQHDSPEINVTTSTNTRGRSRRNRHVPRWYVLVRPCCIRFHFNLCVHLTYWYRFLECRLIHC